MDVRFFAGFSTPRDDRYGSIADGGPRAAIGQMRTSANVGLRVAQFPTTRPSWTGHVAVRDQRPESTMTMPRRSTWPFHDGVKPEPVNGYDLAYVERGAGVPVAFVHGSGLAAGTSRRRWSRWAGTIGRSRSAASLLSGAVAWRWRVQP